MSKQAPVIEATKRDRLGTRYARRLRTAGRLPAVIYGHKKDPVAIDMDLKQTLLVLHHGSRLLSVSVEGKAETCMVKDLQFDYLGTNVIHMDLARVDLTERVTVQARLNFIGTPAGLKVPGAIFRTISETVEVTCTAADIPSEAIPIDISHLEAGAFLTAGELGLPPELTLEEEADTPVCRIAMVSEEEEEPDEAAEGEPEVIGEAEASDEAAADGEESKDE
ncbi:MAG: 50S ribosomal protein L25 [Planctomycetes bacterium]|nr:50S ribosomal protein L25 [Planctomycetota bacterium]NOG54559.1 50S ribosomal protein L25 [Planctomycetota bacterium]